MALTYKQGRAILIILPAMAGAIALFGGGVRLNQVAKAETARKLVDQQLEYLVLEHHYGRCVQPVQPKKTPSFRKGFAIDNWQSAQMTTNCAIHEGFIAYLDLSGAIPKVANVFSGVQLREKRNQLFPEVKDGQANGTKSN